MRAYPVTLTPDPDGGFTVTFRDVPEAITEGDSREEALLRAEDALESALAMYVMAKEPLPTASAAQPGEAIVPLSALGMAKAALYEAMRGRAGAAAALAPAAGRPRARPAPRLKDGTGRSSPCCAQPAAHRGCRERGRHGNKGQPAQHPEV